jgi:hypothetical protein
MNGTSLYSIYPLSQIQLLCARWILKQKGCNFLEFHAIKSTQTHTREDLPRGRVRCDDGYIPVSNQEMTSSVKTLTSKPNSSSVYKEFFLFQIKSRSILLSNVIIWTVGATEIVRIIRLRFGNNRYFRLVNINVELQKC